MIEMIVEHCGELFILFWAIIFVAYNVVKGISEWKLYKRTGVDSGDCA